MSDLIRKEGPGAATATTEVPIIEVEHEGGHVLEPEWKRLPIGPDHILYPVVVGLALFPILMGAAGHHLADDMPDDDTHPFFPDHFSPYPFIDAIGGPKVARRMGWKTWPVPGRNFITGAGYVVFLAIIALLTLWALAG